MGELLVLVQLKQTIADGHGPSSAQVQCAPLATPCFISVRLSSRISSGVFCVSFTSPHSRPRHLLPTRLDRPRDDIPRMGYAAFGSCAMSSFRIQALDLFRRMSESIANGEKAFPGGDAPKGDGASSSRSEKVRPLDAECSLLLARCGISRVVANCHFRPLRSSVRPRKRSSLRTLKRMCAPRCARH